MGVSRWLSSLTLETASQFQRYVLGHYNELDKHIEISSLDVVSGNMLGDFQYNI